MSDPNEGFVNTEEIGRRIGHQPLLSAFIVQVLGVPPSKKDRRAMLWSEAEFQLICVKLAQHAEKVRNAYIKL